MRRRAKIDANQSDIVAVLRQMGVSVQSLAAVGSGCPDLLCGWRGRNYLLEVKDGSKPPSERTLTRDQVEWHSTWPGQVAVVYSVSDAIDVVMGNRPQAVSVENKPDDV